MVDTIHADVTLFLKVFKKKLVLTFPCIHSMSIAYTVRYFGNTRYIYYSIFLFSSIKSVRRIRQQPNVVDPPPFPAGIIRTPYPADGRKRAGRQVDSRQGGLEPTVTTGASVTVSSVNLLLVPRPPSDDPHSTLRHSNTLSLSCVVSGSLSESTCWRLETGRVLI